MVDTNTIEKIEKYPINEKIEIIESILESIKSDIARQNMIKTRAKFTVKEISLGQDIQVDRDALYSERG